MSHFYLFIQRIPCCNDFTSFSCNKLYFLLIFSTVMQQNVLHHLLQCLELYLIICSKVLNNERMTK